MFLYYGKQSLWIIIWDMLHTEKKITSLFYLVISKTE